MQQWHQLSEAREREASELQSVLDTERQSRRTERFDLEARFGWEEENGPKPFQLNIDPMTLTPQNKELKFGPLIRKLSYEENE